MRKLPDKRRILAAGGVMLGLAWGGGDEQELCSSYMCGVLHLMRSLSFSTVRLYAVLFANKCWMTIQWQSCFVVLKADCPNIENVVEVR